MINTRWMDYGSSYLPSELNAAYLYAQLEARDRIFHKRMEIYNYYNENLAPLAAEGKVEQPYVPAECSHNAHMYYLKVRNMDVRTQLLEYLQGKGNLQCISLYSPSFFPGRHEIRPIFRGRCVHD